MAEPLKRLNYFTGQFLEEPDFKAEQLYHERVRRVLTYATFNPGILNGLAVNKIDGGHVLVQKGVAIDALENDPAGDQESRAIVITEDQTINLRSGPGGLGFADGDNVFLYVRYLEDPTDGADPKNTRFQLREEILAVKDTGTGFPLNSNLNVRLGKVTLAAGDLTLVPAASTNRVLATLRLGAATTSPGAVLQSIAVQPPAPTLTVGGSQLFQAIGAFSDSTTRGLTSADGLQWSTSNSALVTILASTGLAQAVAAGGPVTITATVGAITGAATVQVQPPAAVPVINFLSPPQQISTGNVDINGQNIRDPAKTPGTDLSTGPSPTVVRLFKGAVSNPVSNVTARLDVAGRQVVRIVVPGRPGAWGPQELVTLELQFGGGPPATSPFQYDD